MPDTYITTQTDKGSVNISEEVIAAITSAAVREVEGVADLSAAAGVELADKRPAARGVRVRFADGAATVEAAILVQQGANITGVAERAQRAAAAAVESTTGLHSTVNIHVAGVSFAK